MAKDPPLVVNGWTLYAHPLFTEQVEDLRSRVEALRKKHPDSYRQKKDAKILAAIYKLALEEIPANPEDPRYRQGKTLGGKYKHWFRAKFYQQYRLFFRYHIDDRGGKPLKVIIYAWVNDDSTKRAYGSKTDAYEVFRKMLEDGNPPDNWDTLSEAAKAASKGLKSLRPQRP